MSTLSAEEKYRNFIPEESREYLEKLFAEFKRTVTIEVYTAEGEHREYNDFTLNICRAFNVISDKIELREYAVDSEMGKNRNIIATPTVLISPDEYDIRFLGAPAGEEGRALVEALNLASKGADGISESTKEILEPLEEDRLVKIFASPTCPYCPGQAINAFKAAVARPDKISAWNISTLDNENMAHEYKVGSVPHTDINDTVTFTGLEPEEKFMLQLLFLKPLEEVVEEQRAAKAETTEDTVYEDVDLAIIGGGPAGMSAGIYAKRSGLSCIILEKQGVGGQVALTPKVENYPGFTNIQGFELVEILGSHAREYTDIQQFAEVKDVKYGPRIEITTDEKNYRAKGVLLATGVNVRMLGVPGEDKFYGHGVSYCATCDGNFYKGGKAVIVGGGNTALTDALHLKHLGIETTIVHRGDKFRAEKVLQDSVNREGINIIWNSQVTEIIGEDQVESARIVNKDGTETILDTDVVFVAIGHTANTELAEKLGCELRPDGFIKVDPTQRTSVERVYAAGDVTGGVRQIITATGQGAAAALTAFDDFTRLFDDIKDNTKNIW
ncbi:FAD-dependent oxidoreductase [Maridesulfovibrio salexigens]|uniref:FAD-dependent pyridine nucleotide-disulphide oxidoreductase n=1 Tax=Maridesulfovibrio salexigens (strain ATCC 14822 / DSM 2638 / NCIMB 8403 / VKM B-1763) TaxID=526222 RepID=C6BU75_MARSD|nr:FAD-dependent oxidoreductase [Maridesulfovibrio salexigens]ACS81784.1 FAD-dependent pyridine nucleotide-disulphide oxidoreductase [Maridesulfovibrio salexigens DSM 2638]